MAHGGDIGGDGTALRDGDSTAISGGVSELARQSRLPGMGATESEESLGAGKIDSGPNVEPHMAALNALERTLRKGTSSTLPTEDAERIAGVARRHGVASAELAAAAADIRDWTRKPSLPLAVTVWRVLGDPGADVLDLAAALLGDLNYGSVAAI